LSWKVERSFVALNVLEHVMLLVVVVEEAHEEDVGVDRAAADSRGRSEIRRGSLLHPQLLRLRRLLLMSF
jgi:hypothetical protein